MFLIWIWIRSEKPKLDIMTRNSARSPSLRGVLSPKKVVQAQEHKIMTRWLEIWSTESWPGKASYLRNHQQISQSSSALNAGLCWSVSHLLGSLLNFIRQDLNTDEAGGHTARLSNHLIINNSQRVTQQSRFGAKYPVSRSETESLNMVSGQMAGQSQSGIVCRMHCLVSKCHSDHRHWAPDQRQIRRPGHCTMGLWAQSLLQH